MRAAGWARSDVWRRPSRVMTAGGAGLPKDADLKLVMRQMALDKPRGPETVASLIAFLASEDAAHVNGESIRVEGGTLA